MFCRDFRRGLAAFLLLLSPAIGGQLLPWIHPCPVDQPVQAAAKQMAMAGHAGHQGHSGDSSPQHHHEGQCSCPGTCHTPAITASPRITPAVAAVESTPQVASWPVIERTEAPPRPIDRLPPQTAPPLS